MRVVVYSSVAPEVLDHLLRRLAPDAPGVTVAGVLYETGRSALPGARRIGRFVRLLRDPAFLRYVGHRAGDAAGRRAAQVADAALRWIHAAPRDPNGPPLTLDRLIEHWRGRGVAFHVTGDLHDGGSLAFVRGLEADLGLIYGTRILKPSLFTLPARGSINIHKHKLPDYRGSGRPGLWELLDGCAEQTVTVHRVVEEVDAGAVLGERSFPIEPGDDLESVQMKADVLAVDLIADVLRDERLGRAAGRPQPPGGRLFKGYQPHQRHALECRIRASRPRWRPAYRCSWARRVSLAAALPLVALRNRRRTRGGTHPVIVLVHDPAGGGGLPAERLARHVRYLRKHYRLVSLAEAVEVLRRGRVDVRTVVLASLGGDAGHLGWRAIGELESVPVALGADLDVLQPADAVPERRAGSAIAVRRCSLPASRLELELLLQELIDGRPGRRRVPDAVTLSPTALPPARG